MAGLDKEVKVNVSQNALLDFHPQVLSKHTTKRKGQIMSSIIGDFMVTLQDIFLYNKLRDNKIFAHVPQGRAGIFIAGKDFNERYFIEKTARWARGREILFVRDRREQMRPKVIKVIFLNEEEALNEAAFNELDVMLKTARGSAFTCSVFEVGKQMIDETAYYYMVLPFCEAGDLRSLINKHKVLGNRPPLRYLFEIAWALTFMNQKFPGFIHLDLKPENILLSRYVETETGISWVLNSPRAILADFGLAEITGRQKKTPRGTTLPYASPEYFLKKEVDARSDMFSLGTTMYEYICGTNPFLANTHEENEVIKNICDPAFNPPTIDNLVAGLPQSIISATTTCLQKDPDKRYKSFQELMEELSKGFSFVCEKRRGHFTKIGQKQCRPDENAGVNIPYHDDGLKEIQKAMRIDAFHAAPGYYEVRSTLLFSEYGVDKHDRFKSSRQFTESAKIKKTAQVTVKGFSLGDIDPYYMGTKIEKEYSSLLAAGANLKVINLILDYFGTPEDRNSLRNKLYAAPTLGPILYSNCYGILDKGLSALLLVFQEQTVDNHAKYIDFLSTAIKYFNLCLPFIDVTDEYQFDDIITCRPAYERDYLFTTRLIFNLASTSLKFATLTTILAACHAVKDMSPVTMWSCWTFPAVKVAEKCIKTIKEKDFIVGDKGDMLDALESSKKLYDAYYNGKMKELLGRNKQEDD